MNARKAVCLIRRHKFIHLSARVKHSREVDKWLKACSKEKGLSDKEIMDARIQWFVFVKISVTGCSADVLESIATNLRDLGYLSH